MGKLYHNTRQKPPPPRATGNNETADSKQRSRPKHITFDLIQYSSISSNSLFFITKL